MEDVAHGTSLAEPAQLAIPTTMTRRVFHIVVTGQPIPQGSLSVFHGRIVHQNDAALRKWRTSIGLQAAKLVPEPVSGPVAVEAVFGLPRPRTVKRSEPHVKPDVDKLLRALLDALTGTFYVDDSQVVSVFAEKRYGQAGVEVRLESW